MNKMEKIIWLSHTEKIWWARLTPSDKSVIKIHKILKKHNPDGWGLWLYDNEFNPDYKKWINSDHHFFNDIESGYIIFVKPHINLLLRKDSPLFNKLRDDFLKSFKFKDPNKKASKK